MYSQYIIEIKRLIFRQEGLMIDLYISFILVREQKREPMPRDDRSLFEFCSLFNCFNFLSSDDSYLSTYGSFFRPDTCPLYHFRQPPYDTDKTHSCHINLLTRWKRRWGPSGGNVFQFNQDTSSNIMFII